MISRDLGAVAVGERQVHDHHVEGALLVGAILSPSATVAAVRNPASGLLAVLLGEALGEQ